MTTRKFPPSVAAAKTSQGDVQIVPRRFPRATVDLPAQYALEGQSDWHGSTIAELGGGGVRLQTKEDVATGTVMSLRFELQGQPITAQARVAMSLFDKSRERFIHGVAFTAIDPRAQETIVQRVVALQGEKQS